MKKLSLVIALSLTTQVAMSQVKQIGEGIKAGTEIVNGAKGLTGVAASARSLSLGYASKLGVSADEFAALTTSERVAAAKKKGFSSAEIKDIKWLGSFDNVTTAPKMKSTGASNVASKNLANAKVEISGSKAITENSSLGLNLPKTSKEYLNLEAFKSVSLKNLGPEAKELALKATEEGLGIHNLAESRGAKGFLNTEGNVIDTTCKVTNTESLTVMKNYRKDTLAAMKKDSSIDTYAEVKELANKELFEEKFGKYPETAEELALAEKTGEQLRKEPCKILL